jgi:hypothetical protein
MPLYLYGVVRADAEPPTAAELVEPATGPLRVEAHEDVGALVTGFTSDRAGMKPANVAAHHDVVERAAAGGVIIPARFGVLVDSARLLREEFLAPRRGEFLRSLDMLDGRVEVRVTASYVGDAALREAVESDPHLRRLSGRVRARPRAAGYYDRIALGELVVRQLGLLQDRDVRELLARVRPQAEQQRPLEASEPGSSRFALLVPRDGFDAVLGAIDRYADEQSTRMAIEVVGPLAPWDFVEGTTQYGADPVGSAASSGR